MQRRTQLIRDGALRIDCYTKDGPRKMMTCDNVCLAAGRYRVTILGWPVGVFCKKCSNSMQRIWDDALGTQEQEAA